MFTLTLLLLCHLLLQSAVAEPPVNIPSQDYTAPFVSGGGGGHSAGGGYPSAGGGGGYPSAASGSGYNSNAAAYNAALDFNSNNQIGDGGGYSGGHGAGNGGAKAPLTSYGTPSYESHNGHNHEEYGEPKAYEFGYQVKDDYTGTNYNRQEKSDGNQVTGSYRVALPDGRTQIVTYYADWQTGFHADVRYEGEAHYPETYNNNNGYPNNNNNNNNNNNGYHQQQQPSQDYGVPSNNINNNNYNDNTGYSNNNYNNDRYDTYSSNAFGNKVRPNQEYGAP